jgi:hypothetical protein
MAWLVIAAAITLRTARTDKGLPFGLTWWSFTFPVSTCVTGTIGLAARTGADLLRYGAAGLFLPLLAAWLIVAIQTVHGGASGRLFLPAAAPRPEAAVGRALDHQQPSRQDHRFHGIRMPSPVAQGARDDPAPAR